MKLNVNPLQRNPLGRNPRIPAAATSIKNWARSALCLEDETVISVNELTCAKPGCPPRETVILILRKSAPAMRLSIHKAIPDVCERDVIDASVDILHAKGVSHPVPGAG